VYCADKRALATADHSHAEFVFHFKKIAVANIAKALTKIVNSKVSDARRWVFFFKKIRTFALNIPPTPPMSKSKLIPSIHNYCDRWCERCVFVERCAVGVEELERWKLDTPMTDEEMWSTVSDHFKESLRMLDEMLREAGIDPAEVRAEPEPIPDPDMEKLEAEIFERGMAYFKLTDGFFKTNQEFLTAREAETQQMAEMEIPIDVEQLEHTQEAIEIIHQYAAFYRCKSPPRSFGHGGYAQYRDLGRPTLPKRCEWQCKSLHTLHRAKSRLLGNDSQNLARKNR
jgi:hypothetical protein